MTSLFPTGFNEQLLWLDPLESSAVPGTVLRAEEIREYVERFNLIIDQKAFKESNPSNLKGASYSTNPDPSEGWIIRRKGIRKGQQRNLDICRDARGDHFIVPPNSFVFIRLLQTLRMPFYLIGRFNLKIRYVYRGLLLGTGPHIDPGYTGRIYIPLHNFTNESVNIYINESFVSFEFERTSPIKLNGKSPATLEEFYELYENQLRLIDRRKIQDRNSLEAYLEGGRPYSALGFLVKQLRRMRYEFRRRKLIEWTAAAAMAVLVGTYAISTYGLFQSTTDRERHLQERIEQISKEQIQPQTTLRVQMDALLERVQQLAKDMESMKATRVTPTPTPNTDKKQ